ncbi:MAG TPA: Rieske (2Fe-2S) protein [Stellaceae bacterium]|jgi:nitrite reductase/ring-hydroxylating ferredoxin subunit|nr:Rieske (2Fe-2S) protein [Stellaceae bacterium]
MELPDSIIELGEQLDKGSDIAPDPELFDAYEVFAVEVARILTQPWLAVDHASRLAADGDYFRAEIGSRSMIVVRESADQIHAMRNACLHAGYRVCEDESGRTTQLFCQYHGWYYALDGRLTEPVLRPELLDRSRYRLARYAMQIKQGLILVDMSKFGPEAPPVRPTDLGALPDLSDRPVARRQRYSTTTNWKKLRRFLWDSPDLAFGGGGCEDIVELGPLSFVANRDGDAVMLRLIPRFPGHTDFEVVEMPNGGGSVRSTSAGDPIGDALRDNAESIAEMPLDRSFYSWYWSLMSPPAAA